MPAQDCDYFAVGHIPCTRTAHHHNIQTRKTGLVLTEALSRQTLDAITTHRIFYAFFRYHQTKARGITAVFPRTHGQHAARRLILPVKNQLVFTGPGQPAAPAETLLRSRPLPGINSDNQSGGQHQAQSDAATDQADRRVLPLARRRLITRRPPGVLIRARNPWVRLRLITLG